MYFELVHCSSAYETIAIVESTLLSQLGGLFKARARALVLNLTTALSVRKISRDRR